MSKVQALYHIVFCTKRREPTIPLNHKADIYRFIWKIIENHKCKLYCIGGIQNHIHILLDLHPSVTLSELMKQIKGVSSSWMKSDTRFNGFQGWAADYFASTISPDSKHSVINYIMSQEIHHLGEEFGNEITRLYQAAGLEYDERDLQ